MSLFASGPYVKKEQENQRGGRCPIALISSWHATALPQTTV
jgi:hypothetical protein